MLLGEVGGWGVGGEGVEDVLLVGLADLSWQRVEGGEGPVAY